MSSHRPPTARRRRRRRTTEPGASGDPERWAGRRRRERRRRARADRRRRRWLRALAYASTAGLVAVGALGLLARVSSPASDWVPQVAAVALPMVAVLSLTAAVALAAAFTKFRRPAAAACAVACAAVFSGWVLSAPGIGPAAGRTGAGAEFRLVTLNLGGSDGREGEVAQYVAGSDANVVVLQEAGAGEQPYRAAVARIALEGYEPLVDPAKGLGRQVILSRLPVVSYKVGYLGIEEVHSGVYGRAVVWAAGREVAVYNVHLRSFGRWRENLRPSDITAMRQDLVERAVEAERLRAILDAEPLPYLVAGDLNSTPDQWAYRLIAEGTRDALSVEGGLLPRTFPSRFPLVQIDVVFASPEFDVVSASVGPGGLSDHRPVQAVLSLDRDRK